MILEIGMTVKILPQAEYKNRFEDAVGIIEKIHSTHIGIKFENIENPASSYGVFWFSEQYIEILESEDEQIMFDNCKIAGVKFLDGSNTDREYFYALYDDSIEIGDLVVAKTGHHGFALVKISSIEEYKPNIIAHSREIICKVDMTAYNERQAKAAKIKSLKVEMDKKVMELQQTAIYELLAEKDPGLKQMLEEYKSLIG